MSIPWPYMTAPLTLTPARSGSAYAGRAFTDHFGRLIIMFYVPDGLSASMQARQGYANTQSLPRVVVWNRQPGDSGRRPEQPQGLVAPGASDGPVKRVGRHKPFVPGGHLGLRSSAIAGAGALGPLGWALGGGTLARWAFACGTLSWAPGACGTLGWALGACGTFG